MSSFSSSCFKWEEFLEGSKLDSVERKHWKNSKTMVGYTLSTLYQLIDGPQDPHVDAIFSMSIYDFSELVTWRL